MTPKLPRYYVIGCTGYRINASSTKPSGSSAPGTSYSVLDRYDCHREVGVFYAGPQASSAYCWRRAQALCDELNRNERTWELTA